MKSALRAYFLMTILTCTFAEKVESQDYYWREYTGKIPKDAVAGGTDEKGHPTYVGQVLVYPWGLLPASIYEGSKTAIASAALQTHRVEKNVKILCANKPEKLKWIPTSKDKIELLTAYELILGGVDNGYPENIGRANHKGQTIIGKVIRKPLKHDGLWIPDDGKEIKLDTYEVLVYDDRPRHVEGYYWREFKGKVPADAIPGGVDRLGRSTYIGQAFVPNLGPLPASIYEDSPVAVASGALKTHRIERHIKILCSKTPEKFSWIPTTTKDIDGITNCDLVLGGVDIGYEENIGRINYNEEVILGKVIRKPLEHDGLWVPDNGKETRFPTFEVLGFDCALDLNVRADLKEA